MADFSFSRRSFLSEVPMVAALALSPAAAALPVPKVEMSADIEVREDAKFWRAHAEWKSFRADWDADKDADEDAVWERHGAREVAAMEKMLLIPVRTAFAVMAKYLATGGECINLPSPALTSIQMIEWDLGRVAMRELV